MVEKSIFSSGVYSSTSGRPKSEKQLKWESEDAERRKARAQQDVDIYSM